MEKVIADAKERMKKAVDHLEHEFAQIRTGRASAALLDRVKVDYFGSEMPINQLASVAVPEPRQLLITPWDKGALKAIEKGIMTSDLNLNPSSDGNIIRLELPALTEERRKELAKLVSQGAEAGRVAVRNIRRDANAHLDKMQKSSAISEDDAKRGEKEIQDATDKAIKEMDTVAERKGAEVMEV
jgi:ribosome recycling factor